MTHPDTASDLFSTPPAAPANPAWWTAAIEGTCTHGGHGYDGDECTDAPADDNAIPATMDETDTTGALAARQGADALAATRAAGRDWRGVAPADFGRRTRHVQTAMMLTAADGTVLAPGADELGTLDLFSGDL
jgi:hypothetical protein